MAVERVIVQQTAVAETFPARPRFEGAVDA